MMGKILMGTYEIMMGQIVLGTYKIMMGKFEMDTCKIVLGTYKIMVLGQNLISKTQRSKTRYQ
jgi:hypothetical protein